MALSMPEKTAAAEAEFESLFRTLRNKLQSLKRDEFICGLIRTIRSNEKLSPAEYKGGQPLPWTMLTLLKLACEHCEKNSPTHHATPREFAIIYNLVFDLEDRYGATILLGDIHCFFFSLIHQQFWHQIGIHAGVVARLNFFFCQENMRSAIPAWFENKYGLPCSVFAELLLSVWIVIEENVIVYDIKNILQKAGHKSEHVDIFLSTVSLSIDNVDMFVRERKSRIRSNFFQFGERTPFVFAPLIRTHDNKYIPISRKIIERSAHLLLYEFIKASENDSVLQSFDNLFERYVGELLDAACLTPTKGAELRKKHRCKTPDFLVLCNNKRVMIEAKSVRLSNIAVANPVSGNIPNDLRDNVVKALKQGIEFAHLLDKQNSTLDNFLLIVTYDDLYLGPPQSAWDSYFSELIHNNNYDFAFESILPPINIFVVSIRELEQICNSCNGKYLFNKLIEDAVAANSDPQTQKHSIIQNIPSNVLPWRNPFIREHFNIFFDRIRDRISNTKITLFQ